jgi:hypothetical protein
VLKEQAAATERRRREEAEAKLKWVEQAMNAPNLFGEAEANETLTR